MAASGEGPPAAPVGRRVAWAAGLLSLLELAALARAGLVPRAEHVVLAAAWSCTVVLVAEGVLAATLLAGRRSGLLREPAAARRAALAALVALPAALAAARSLTAGDWIASQPFAGPLRAGLGAGLVAAAATASWAAGRLLDSGRRMRSVGLALLVVGLAALADRTVLVGEYPAFHLVLDGVILAALLLGARAAFPTRPGGTEVPWRRGVASRWAPRLLVAAAVVAPAVIAWRWDAPAAASLATWSDGTLARARRGVADLVRRVGVVPPPPSVEDDELVFHPSDTPGVRARRRAARHVVLVVADALRDDHVGPRPDGTTLTPRLDALGEALTRYPVAYAASDHTGRSLPALHTGLPLDVVEALSRAGVRAETWLSRLDAAGVATFHNGSDHVFRKHAHLTLPPAFGARRVGTLDPKAEGLEDEVLAFLVETGGAASTHWSDAHVRRQGDVAAAYAEGVRAVDRRLGRLVEGLAAAGLWDETLLVVTSDHGWSLGERRRWQGGHGCFETMLRVPLLVHWPGAAAAPSGGTGALVSALDVVPTILDVMADAAPGAATAPLLLPGRSLLAGPGGDRVVCARGAASHMVRRGSLKRIDDRAADLVLAFDLAADPGERFLLDDAGRRGTLAALSARDRARHAALATALVRAARRDLDGPALDVLLDPEASLARLAALVRDYPRLSPSTRRALLAVLYERRLDGFGADLDAVSRRVGRDDPLLLVRAWSGSGAAADELLRRWRTLAAPAHRWLAETVGALPDELAAALASPLTDEVLRLAATEPPLGSEEERFMTLAAWGLARQQGRETPRALLALLVDRANAWEAPRPRPIVSVLRRPRFDWADLVRRVGDAVGEDTLDVLDGLRRTDLACATLVEAVAELESQAAREWLVTTIAAESRPRALAAFVDAAEGSGSERLGACVRDAVAAAAR